MRHTTAEVQPWPYGKTPLDIVLDCTVGGGWAGAPDLAGPAEIPMIVDWIRAKKTT
jgi:hypothetical protein